MLKTTDERTLRTAALAKALAHPARISILELLASKPNCICGDITDQIPLAQSTVSQHLKVLKEAGLIRGEIDGVRTCYCLDPEGVAELTHLLSTLLSDLQIQTNPDCC